MTASKRQPLDVTGSPELSRLADDVQATRRPRVLRKGDQDVALVLPLGTATPTPMPYNPALEAVLAGLPEDSVVVRTAGALHTDQPFLGYDEEEEAVALAIGYDVVAQWEPE